MLSNQADAFSLGPDLHFFNSASRGPLPIAAQIAGRAALERQFVPTPTPPAQYFERGETLRGLVGSLVNCSADRVAITPSVSYGLSIAGHNTHVRRGRTVVMPEEEFLSDVYSWLAVCQRDGGALRTVPRPSSEADISARWTEAFIDAIDESTAVVNLSTVHWTDGMMFDVEAIGRRAREVGALFVLDGTQSVGAMTFDFDVIQPDLLLVAAYKWLLGPYQIGVAVLGDRLLEGEPFEHHWSNRAGSEDTTQVGYQMAFRDGARKFDVGEHSNDIALSMLNASVEQVMAWGADNIEQYCRALMQPLEDYLANSPYRAAAASEHCAHILGIRADDPALLARAVAALDERNVRVSLRGDSLRVSPYLFNTRNDVDVLIEGLNVAV